MSVAILDNRIAYGARCTWWDSIRKVGKMKPGASGHSLPCCPHCGGVLFEMENEGQWFAGADRYESNGHPGYRAMIEWARGKCFKNMAEMKAAYDARAYQENAMSEMHAVLLETRKALFMCAASCQGGHSDAGEAAAKILGIPFPIHMDNLEAKAISEGLSPDELWPWLMRQRRRIAYSSAAGD